MIKRSVLKKLEQDIDNILLNATIAYREYLVKSLKELFVKYLKKEKNNGR